MIYRFGDCELDDRRYELRRGGVPCHLEPQVFEVLAYLVRHRDRVVPRAELLDEIWGSRFVSDSALASRVKAARRAVGDSGREQGLIRTVHGRGYQFLAPVREQGATALPAAVAPVGREAELARLGELYGLAEQGRRQARVRDRRARDRQDDAGRGVPDEVEAAPGRAGGPRPVPRATGRVRAVPAHPGSPGPALPRRRRRPSTCCPARPRRGSPSCRPWSRRPPRQLERRARE